MNEAQSLFGNNVNVMKVDVDDANNAALVKLFKIGPIPTVICLNKDGKVVSETIGETNFINFARGMSALVR